MRSTKILTSEVESRRVSSLPTRPTAPATHGGLGLTSTKLKEAFDSLALLIIERFNLLIGDVSQIGDDSLAGAVPTGISKEHTLADLFGDIKNGNFASYLKVGEASLANTLLELSERIKALEEGAK